MPSRNLRLLMAMSILSLACLGNARHSPYGATYTQVFEAIHNKYIEPTDEQAMLQAARKIDKRRPRTRTLKSSPAHLSRPQGAGMSPLDTPDQFSPVRAVLAQPRCSRDQRMKWYCKNGRGTSPGARTGN